MALFPLAIPRNRSSRVVLWCILVFPMLLHHIVSSSSVQSGIEEWVDVETPQDQHMKISSRGSPLYLVMSDEFNTPNRSFEPGKDHIWTSLEIPDGVNAALEYYSHNMTTTKKEGDVGYLQITTDKAEIDIRYFNPFSHPPVYETKTMYYRSGMMQSWNKFCFQGGMVEVAALLPGALTPETGNPDLESPSSYRVKHGEYYPTWPGVWLMGNLGRALFSASTNRMWPWSFNRCVQSLENQQRISACNSNPGFGLNKNQGRGAPEIDILEGGGVEISASIQVAPGMPSKYRISEPELELENNNKYCSYDHTCRTIGGNDPGIPTNFWKNKGHGSWYPGLRYSAHALCEPDVTQRQNVELTRAEMAKGIMLNSCNKNTCPGSRDIFGDTAFIPGTKTPYGFNPNGTCLPFQNAYRGAYLCDPDNNSTKCTLPYNGTQPNGLFGTFNYQMDAISANYPAHNAIYREFLRYKIEWVPGSVGYIRWELNDQMLFEIPASSLDNVPQDKARDNPIKLMIEEPMYVIFNVAVSNSWGSKPPSGVGHCQGLGKDPKVNAICSGFPMYLKIDYIRIWQENNTMSVGCDPPSHPTAQFINEHIAEYTDQDNPMEVVVGMASCVTDMDCTSNRMAKMIVTGVCDNGRCKCLSPDSFAGPRCSFAVGKRHPPQGVSAFTGKLGPSFVLSCTISSIIVLWTLYLMVRQSMNKIDYEPNEALYAQYNSEALSLSTTPLMASHVDIAS